IRSSMSSTTTRTALRSSTGSPSSGIPVYRSFTWRSHHNRLSRRSTIAVRTPILGDMSEKATESRKAGRFRAAAAIGATVLARLAEVALAFLGILYAFSDARVSTRALRYLAWWDLIALFHLGVGFIVVRRTSANDGPPPAAPRNPHWWRDLQ